MLWVYDEAISSDLANSIDCHNEANTTVKVVEPDGVLSLIAQIQEDNIQFPLVCLTRESDYSLDTSRTNFTWMKRGVPIGYQAKENNLYFERALPIELSYTVNVLATTTVDLDEILRELLFKYNSMYFLPVTIPYTGNMKERVIRIGLSIDPTSIKKESAALDYIQTGKLYQASFMLKCEGAVLLTYVPQHVNNVIIEEPSTFNNIK